MSRACFNKVPAKVARTHNPTGRAARHMLPIPLGGAGREVTTECPQHALGAADVTRRKHAL